MFLNPDRPGLPDIDTDFSDKNVVLRYLTNKYGEDHVAKIGTYTTMTSKAVLKDVARVLGIDHNIINDLNKRIPVDNGNVMPLETAVVEIPEIVQANKKYPELFELAIDLQSMPKNAGVHACFSADTKVRTDKGLRKIANIKVGDKVLTHKGRYREVTYTHQLENQELFILEVENYMDTEVTGDHPYWTSQLIEEDLGILRNGEPIIVNALSEPVWKRVEDLEPGIDYVMIPKLPDREMKSKDTWPQESPDKQSVYQINGNIWLQVKDVKKHLPSETVYTLTVEEDTSYTANGLAVLNCGVQISPLPIDENLPLMMAKDSDSKERIVVTQYEGGTLEDLGYVKFDILALKTLTMVDVAIKEIKRRHNVDVDIDELEPDDTNVFDMIRAGNTSGVFQLELTYWLPCNRNVA